METRSITLIILVIITVNTADKSDNSALNKGVVFVNQGNFLLTTSHWTLVVDITFEEFDLQLIRLGEHLQSLKQLIWEA